MKRALLVVIAFGLIPLFAGEEEWEPTRIELKDLPPADAKDLEVAGRQMGIFQHGVKKEWGYKEPQKDTFIVIHPKVDRQNAPLYVVLHSAGHNVFSCVKCTRQVGNHDLYHAPENFYALYLDCRAHQANDWWWGGMHVKDANLTKKNAGAAPRPVERRVMDCVRWTIEKYGIDVNRVYLCGISMGGTGTLGIGMRNGDVFAAVKANVPAGIEHVSHRMYSLGKPVPADVKWPDPPVVVDYSAPNDGWSFGHERFVKAMNDRKYALYFYWGPFGHASNHAQIMQMNDLINSFDWLNVKKNEAYAVFTNASCNNKIPWPDKLDEKAPGQVNAFFRWKNSADKKERLEMLLFLTAPSELKTRFEIPKEATVDVSFRRLQCFEVKPGETVKWTFGAAKGEVKADADGLVMLSALKVTQEPVSLSLRH